MLVCVHMCVQVFMHMSLYLFVYNCVWWLEDNFGIASHVFYTLFFF